MMSHTTLMNMRDLMTGENFIGTELLVFTLGGVAYALLEILFRGHTHWSMVMTGGACVVTLYILLDWLNKQPLLIAAVVGAGIVTCYEFAVGCIVNLRYGWAVWDYSKMEGNVLGQICPAFSFLWFCLCFMFLGAVRLLS